MPSRAQYMYTNKWCRTKGLETIGQLPYCRLPQSYSVAHKLWQVSISLTRIKSMVCYTGDDLNMTPQKHT